ncbi:MAG: hypothetical protein LBN23_00670, partial [Paludibacter sp.]|nr:hypothetical protein [Paludibacter sp.]
RLFLLEQRLTFDNPQNSDLDTNLFSCPIGADNIFISANGDFHMCMKSDYSFPLGNVFSGFDKQALITLYKSHIIGFRKKCKNCWAICFCQICPAQILFEKQFYFPTNEDCNIIKGKALVEIQKYILLTRYENLYNQIKQFYTNSQSDDYRLDTGLININYLNHLLL